METGIGKYKRAARVKWEQWRAAGNEPAFNAAKAIFERKFGEQSRLGVKVARVEKSGKLDANFSFIIWDITENGSGALDYSGNDAFLNDLLSQAREIVSGVYSREAAKIGGKTPPFRAHRVEVDTLRAEKQAALDLLNRHLSGRKEEGGYKDLDDALRQLLQAFITNRDLVESLKPQEPATVEAEALPEVEPGLTVTQGADSIGQ